MLRPVEETPEIGSVAVIVTEPAAMAVTTALGETVALVVSLELQLKRCGVPE